MISWFIYRIHVIYRNRVILFRGWLLKMYLLLHGCKVGKKLRCSAWPYFRAIPFRNISIGDHVTIGKNSTLQVQKSGELYLDDYSKLTQDVIISVSSSVRIGKYSGIAEFCSIRDSDHGTSKNARMWDQPVISEEIIIGNDVQISLGCSIFRGTKIEDGVIIGANSMVFRNTRTIPYGIYMGNPLKLIGKRN
jgi:acetyltransferase-like isoleucine patch superfamily enzyme